MARARSATAPKRASGAGKGDKQPTNLETKLGEVIGLAMAAQGATQKVRKLVRDNEELGATLERMTQEAAEAERRGTEVAGNLNKTAIMREAREVKKKAAAMMSDYLERGSDALDGFEFLTMAEAGELGHWEVLSQMNKRAKHRELRGLITEQLRVQKRHVKDVQAGITTLAAEEDPDETS